MHPLNKHIQSFRGSAEVTERRDERESFSERPFLGKQPDPPSTLSFPFIE